MRAARHPPGAAGPVIGRDAEQRTLQGALARLVRGVPSRTALVGAGGMGKSTLLDALHDAAAGLPITVLRGRGTGTLRDVPFGTLSTALHPLGSDAVTAALARGREALDPAFPVIEAILELLEDAAATAPVLLLVDDLQWVDPASVRGIATTLERCAAQPLAVVLGSRPARDPAVSAVLTEVARTGQLLHLPPLPPEDVRRLAADRWGGPVPTAMTALVDAAGGNPLVVEEVLAAASASGGLPPRAVVGAALLHRIVGLPETTQDLLRRLALIGGPVDHRLLAVAAGTTLDDVVRLLDPAREGGVVLEDADGVEFSHDLLRAAVADALPDGARHATHREMADRLEAAGAPAALVAEQALLGSSGTDAHAASQVLAAARDAGATSAETTARWLGHALRLAPPGSVRRQAQDASLEVLAWRDPVAAEQVARQALVEEAGGPRRGRLRHRLAQALIAQGRAEESLAELRAAMEEADPVLVARLQADAALRLLHLGDVDGADVAAAQALASPDADPSARASARCALAMVQLWRADVDGAAAHLQAATALGDAHPEVGAVGPRTYQMVLAAEHGDLTAIEASGQAAVRELTAAGVSGFLGWVHTYGAVARYRALALHDALAELDALDALPGSGVRAHTVLARGVEALVALDLGELGRAQRAVEEGLGHLQRSALVGTVRLRLAAARTAAAAGDLDDAWRTLGATWEAATEARALADVLLLAPDVARLGAEVGEAEAVAVALAEVPWPAGPRGEAVRLWSRGLLAGDGSTLVGAAARLGGMGELHRQAEALADAATLDWPGAAAAGAHAARLHRHAGAPTPLAVAARPHRPRWGWEALTGRERDVVGLVMEGMTNQQIASRLGIGRRTVETHVANALRKTGLSSRVQLAVQARTPLPGRG